MTNLAELSVKRLGFGAMRLPTLSSQQEIDLEQTKQMVDLMLQRGFHYFDTAYPYHSGHSEVALREALVRRHPRETFLLADKMPVWLVKEHAQYQGLFEEQLSRCGVDYFDFYLLHNMGHASYADTEACDGFGFLQELKAAGKARFVGFSFHDNAALLDQILTKHPEVDFVQLQINYIDWDRPSVQAGACYEIARKHGKPIIVMEPIKGGGLANPGPEVTALFEAVTPNASAASWAVRFAASLDGVITVLSGMSNLEQVQDNISYMQEFVPLSAAEQAAVEQAVAILKQSTAIPCTDCKYCVESCPQRINIPSVFSIYNMTKQFGAMNFPKMHYARQTIHGGKASECIACGACESHCPQHITIIEELKKVAALLE